MKVDKSHFEWIDHQIEKRAGEIPAEIKELYADPEKEYLRKILLEEIRQGCHHFMLFRITEEQRIVFIFRNILNLSYKEISEVLQINENVVKSRLNRAKKNLQKHVKERCQWYNAVSSCTCEKCVGFALELTPESFKFIAEQTHRPEYYQTAAKYLNNIKDVEAVFKKLPLLEYKILPLKEYLEIKKSYHNFFKY